MKPSPNLPACCRWFALFASSLTLFLAPALGQAPAAAGAGTGLIAGTVLAPESGKFLAGAEVSIAGTALHTTTDRSGAFLLSNAPAGARRLVVVYPGQATRTIPVTIVAGQTLRVPVSLGSEVVKLETFTVESAKEGMSAAIAQQKASTNQRIVEASDQYGDISEGNAAEYLKFLPGVNIEYNANDARAIGLRGLPTYLTAITLNGNPLASASSANPNRRFEFEQVSLNNVATIEVNKTLTPDLQATSTAGSVNFVSKSAYDRQGALLTYRGYLTAADSDLYLTKQPGYSATKVYKVQPSGVVDYSVPVSDKFGFDINVSESQIYNDYPRVLYAYQWNPAFGATPHDPYPLTWDVHQRAEADQAPAARGDLRLPPHPEFQGDDLRRLVLVLARVRGPRLHVHDRQPGGPGRPG